VVLVFVFIFIEPALNLFAVFVLYAVSGPVLTLLSLQKHRAARRAGLAAERPDRDR
jgi:CDP-diacylglycerol--serine O-phosphatidyltransferase